jgi:site-specific DNA-cytosine methylase
VEKKLMKMLDLCAGSKSVSNIFKKHGWEVTTLDYLIGWHDIHKDIRKWKPEGKYDFIWASPPCTEYSIAKGVSFIERNIDHSILLACLYCIEILNPQNWILENPRGAMRRYLGQPVQTVYYGDYGFSYAKPTDLWGTLKIPNIHIPKTKYREFRYAAKRSAFERSKVPEKLIDAILEELC